MRSTIADSCPIHLIYPLNSFNPFNPFNPFLACNFSSPLAELPALNQVAVPDLWQQQAVTALREGKDVVVQAPTGAGKTLIFELWSNQGKNRGQAIYTVPTRALANDKLAEWRARGWDVGIATGDLAENLGAPVLVATLETQKNRLIQGDGPALLVVDEYQMLSDLDRGLNYELAMALAPPQTQLLLLSGSVGNPQDVVKWLQRLGRKAVLIRHDERPVPLEEVHANSLSYHVPSEIRGYWPRLVAKALAEDLGPILIFAPRRQAAESMANELARQLPTPNPLQLSTEQKLVVGEHLAKLLKSRVTYHHSGLSYGARAGVIEPLAKAGQLRVVVATMGLAAGINFSLRSVALAGESYRRDEAEQLLKPDELLQMFGRAGRRGLDETGFVLITANELRLLDSHPGHLSRSGAVDWSALLGLMAVAAQHGRDPFREAVRTQERLFTTKPIVLGVEESLRHPDVPCGLRTDAERARHVRKRVREMQNSRGEWETMRGRCAVPVRGRYAIYDLRVAIDAPGSRFRRADLVNRKSQIVHRPVLSDPAALEKVGTGTLCVLSEDEHGKTYGRALTVADRLGHDRVLLAKWIRRLTNWNGRQVPLAVWEEKIVPLVKEKLAQQKTPVVSFQNQAQRILALVSIADLTLRVPVDRLRRRPLEARRARGPARRLRPVPARPRLPPTADQHRRRPALAAARPGGCRRRAHPARPGRQLLQPGRRAGHRRRARGRNLSARRIDLRPRQPGRRLPLRRRGHQPLGRAAGDRLPREVWPAIHPRLPRKRRAAQIRRRRRADRRLRPQEPARQTGLDHRPARPGRH